MNFLDCRVLLFLTLTVFTFTGCISPAKKAEEEKKLEKETRLAEQTQDASFVAFVGRLRKAVKNRDVRVLSTLMSDKFAYSWAPGGEGYGCFQYWDENNLWPEVEKIVDQPFAPNGNFFCAPPAFIQQGEQYTGFRAGIHREKGSLKFAYFVPAENTPMAQPPRAGN